MVNHHKYYDFNDARRAVFEHIESWYNRRRIHSAINYRTPREVYKTALLMA
ncbi:IS3 family transposase [Thermoanaerobacterium sp. RBIITD]|uniref:IS3 family transposase n=1 Tax=Thermoanaerobacterium sp. RBIITD TaxID=1550240 RepID=UPI000BB6FF1C